VHFHSDVNVNAIQQQYGVRSNSIGLSALILVANLFSVSAGYGTGSQNLSASIIHRVPKMVLPNSWQ